MILRAWLPAALLLAAACAWASWPAAVRDLPAPAEQGTGKGGGYSPGCSAAGCHGDDPGPKAWRSSATVWRDDPHARVEETLAGERSLAINERLRITARTDARCLACHVPAAGSSGCASCHGKADGWLAEHPSFRRDGVGRPVYEKRGMAWLKGTADRAAACMGCHVGEKGREVDHELIAAGHPRLDFEYASYVRALPRHWEEEDEQETAWLEGQEAGLAASLRLLEHRTTKADWPEFAELNCFDCHHDLGAGTRPPPHSRQHGKAGWYRSHPLEQFREGTADLLAELRKRVPDPVKVKAGIRDLKPRPTAPALARLKPPARDLSWDEAAWHYHGLAALENARLRRGKPDEDAAKMFAGLRETLGLEPYATPRPRPARADLEALWKRVRGR
ncbi:MAG: cytochrome c family protein [Gemmataceae bacterium]|nr:cytochrome c family protein [Gemmataceae bacterium]